MSFREEVNKKVLHPAHKETATKETIEHYKRCKKVILTLCQHGNYSCSLIGDNWNWYNVNLDEKKAKLWLPSEENYDFLTRKHRTLYWTLQLWTPEIVTETRTWIQKPNGKWGIDKLKEGPLGTRKDTRLMTLSVDIDRVKDKEVTDPNVKKWLEAALKLFADYFKSIGFRSYALFFSGGGGYVMVHPLVTAIGEEEGHDIVYRWEMVQQCFDFFISEMEKQFFEQNPEAKEWIKGFDCLNYDAKRQFKMPLSIHLTQPFAVIPLDKDNPVIDFEKARLPIADKVIEEAANCLRFYDGDVERVGKHIIEAYADTAKEKIAKHHPLNRTFKAVPDDSELDVDSWAPCARNMYNESKVTGKGTTRRLGFLANYMQFVGVPREKAYNIFLKKAAEWNAETSNIFEQWYDGDGEPECWLPTCEKFNREAKGYPHMSFGGMGLCTPDERCKKIKKPLDYHEKKKKRWGGKEVAEIALKFGDFDFGTAKIRRGYEGGLLIRVDSEKYALAERTAPINFYQKNWYVNTIFKKIKKELGDDFEKFWDEIEGEIEDKIGTLPEIEKNDEEKDNVEHLTKGELGDGRYFEEIMIDGVETFAVYDTKNDTYEYLSEINNGGKIIYPRGVGEEEINSLMLADGVEEYGSLAELRKEMVDFALEEFDPVDNRDLFELVVYLALTTWIAPEIMENLIEKFIPIVSARGASETGKKRFLTVMRWLTYRSMYVLKTVKVPTLFRMVAPWGATLILDEADLSDSHENADFVEFMNARADGVSIPRYNASTGELDFFKSFGMTVLAERSAAVDDGFESRKIIYPSDATTKPEEYSLIPPEDWCEKGKQLLRKLLLFKFRHMKIKLPTNLIIPNVNSFRVRESLLLLQSLSDEDEKIKGIIGRIAKKLEERIIIERANSMDGLIINTVYGAIVDEDGNVTAHGENYEIIREHRGREGEGDYSTPITLKTISGTLGDALSPSEVARRWRGLGQGTREQARIDGKRFRGIVQIQNKKMFKKHLKKYVVDVDWEAVGVVLKKQTGQGTIGEGEE